MALIIKNVIVIGGAGNLGTILVAALKEASFNVSILARIGSESKYPSDVATHFTDFSFDSLKKAFQGQDAVLSTVSVEVLANQKAVIDAAIAAGVKRFIPSEFGSDSSINNLASVAPFALPKQDAVNYLRTKEQEGFSWTSIFTGPFFDWALEIPGAVFGWDIDSRKITIYDSGNQKVDVSTIGQIGRAVVAVLSNLSETANRYVYIKSFTVTQRQLHSTLESISGQKFTTQEEDSANVVARSRDYLKQGDWFMGYVEGASGGVFGSSDFGYFGEKSDYWNRILGLREESMEDTVRGVLVKKGII